MRLQLSAQILKPSPPSSSHTHTTPTHHHPLPTSKTTVLVKANDKISRRNLAICTSSTLLFLNNPFQVSKVQAEEDPQSNERVDAEEDLQVSKVLAEEDLQVPKVLAEEDPQSNERVNAEDLQVSKVQAQEDPQSNERVEAEEANSKTKSCTDISPTKRAFLDISIDRELAGRIIIGLYGDDVPVGSSRFSNIVSGAAGISYRRKEFVKIMPNYVQHGGLRSYGVDAELAQRTGSKLAVDDLISEWETINERCPGTKNVAGSVSIIVRDPLKPPPKLKLMARNGKLVIDEEEVGIQPNGTEFVITTKDSPELDLSSLVIGKVLGGMEVLEKIAKVKTVQENSSSNFFRVAKLIGDKRAVVAERGFNRPYSKVIITNCGFMD